jgi:hypothetical protein
VIRLSVALVVVGFIGFAGTSTAQEPAEGSISVLARVSWLTGCWAMSSPGLVIEEHWMPPRGGTMLGMSRTVQADNTTGYELVMIREVDGRLLYEAHPSGQPPAVFEATRSSGEAVTFENPQHDFPRRIIYNRVGADSIRAEIDDGAGGGTVRFVYGRTDCSR